MFQVRPYIEDNVAPQTIIRAFRTASQLALNKVKEIAMPIGSTQSERFVFFNNMFHL